MRRAFHLYKKRAGVSGSFLLDLDDTCLLQGGKSTVLLDVAHALGADVDEEHFAELRHEDAALLEVCLTAYLSGWVELGCTGTVRVPPANLGRLSGYCAFACHSPRMLAYGHVVRQRLHGNHHFYRYRSCYLGHYS